MKKILIISIWVLLGIALVTGLVLTAVFHQNRLCKSIEINIDYNGADVFFTENEIKSYLISRYDSLIGKKISTINENLLESLLKENPYVRNAEVYTNMDGSLHLNIIQRKPIVRIVNTQNQHFYIDDKGVKMPVKNNCPVRVVIANGNITSVYTPFTAVNEQQRDDFEALSKDTVLNSIYKIAMYLNFNDFFNAQIEEIFVNEYDEIELFPKLGDQIIILGSVDNLEEKFSKLMILYKEGFNKMGWDKYSVINLKYKNQVVCTKKDKFE